MTASLAIVVAEARDKVVVPCAALRFRPNEAGPARRGASPDGLEVIYLAESETSIRPVQVKLGISDGVSQAIEDTMGNELVGADIAVGVLSNAARERLKTGAAEQTTNPFMPKPPARNKKPAGPPAK